MNRRELLRSAASTAALAATALPLSRSPSLAQAKTGTLKLGVIMSLSGSFGFVSADLKRGVEIALDRINAKRLEIGGTAYTIEPTFYDNKSDPTTSARLTERAVATDGQHMVLTSAGSTIVKATIPVAQRLRFPIVPLWSHIDGVYSSQKGDPWIFSTQAPFSLMYRNLTEMVATFDGPKVRRAAMIAPNDELGVFSGKEYFPEDVRRAGLELADVEFYPPGSQEYVTSVQRLKRANVDYLVINAFGGDIIGIVKEMQSINWFPKVIGLQSPAGLSDKLGAVLNGMFVPVMWDADLNMTRDPYVGTSADFAQLYIAKHGKAPSDFVAALGAHDLVTSCLVMQRAGTIDDPLKIRDAFRSFDGETFFGPVAFRDDGLNGKGRIYAGQYKDGRTVLVYPSEVRKEEPVYPYPGSL